MGAFPWMRIENGLAGLARPQGRVDPRLCRRCQRSRRGEERRRGGARRRGWACRRGGARRKSTERAPRRVYEQGRQVDIGEVRHRV